MKTILQPHILQWARERAGLSIPALADKFGTTVEKVTSWEQSGELTLAQAEKLARITHTPFGYLFLPTPPDERLPINDFRTVGSQGVTDPSLELLDTVNDALRRQDWYRDYLQSENATLLPFVGSLTVSSDIAGAVAVILKVVAWDAAARAQSSSWEKALVAQIERVEEAGILVMRNGIVGNNTHRPLSVEEFRGFALSDPYAPLIFLNGRDAKAAQMFTLAHELVHVWLGVSGVSNLRQTYAPANDTERFCNAVAAEVLVPADALRTQWERVRNTPDFLPALSKHFKVSSLVILRRLRDADYINAATFTQRYEEEAGRFAEPRDTAGGGNFYRTLRTRLGQRFTAALVESTLEGRTLYRDAFQLLGVSNADVVRKLAQEVGVAA